MASITLKNVPDDLMRALRKAATRDQRSLNQEILHLLTAALERQTEPSGPGRKVQEQLGAWRKLAGKWKSDLSPAEEARQLRRSRPGGRQVDF